MVALRQPCLLEPQAKAQHECIQTIDFIPFRLDTQESSAGTYIETEHTFVDMITLSEPEACDIPQG
jgi:hypothetical protein